MLKIAKKLTKEEFLEEVSGGWKETDAPTIFKLSGDEIEKLRAHRLWAKNVTGDAYVVMDDNANSVTGDKIEEVLGKN